MLIVIKIIADFWKLISNLGLKNPTDKDRYFVITNQLCVIYLGIASFMLYLYTAKGLYLSTYSYLTFFSVLVTTLALNAGGFHKYSRQFLVFSMPLTALLPRLILAQNLEVEPIEYFYAFIIFSFTPQLVFDSATEKNHIYMCFFYYLIFIVGYDFIVPGYMEQMNLNQNYKPSFMVFKAKQVGLYTIFNLVFGLKNFTNYIIEKDLLVTKKLLTDQNQEIKTLSEQINAKTERLENNVTLLSRVNTRLRANNEVLMKLSKSANIKDGNFHSSIAEIGNIIYKTLDVSRVSIWAYDSFQHLIVCVFATTSDNKKNVDMPVLNLDKYPLYFITLQNNRVIPAVDANNNEATRDFKEYYLSPANIKSMLDVPFYIDGKLGGIICCENQVEIREWYVEDENFVQSMADYISLSFESAERKNEQDIILKQKDEISFQNDVLKTQKEFIENINQSLENKVLERTQELQKRNEQLQQFAFANSHTIRGPLSRILGLLNLLDLKDTELDENMLMTNIRQSANEIDLAIKEINQILTSSEYSTDNLL